MKISYSDYIKKTDVSVLVAEAIFSQLLIAYPCKQISEVAESTSGGTPLRSNSDFYNGNIAWLKSGELNDGWIEKSEEFISENGLKNSSAKLHPKGTLLLAMYGATAGKTGITKIEASTNQAVCALFPNEQVIQEYLFWFLRQHRYKFIEISKGGAQPNLSQSVINETKLPVPNKNLQKQIADLLFKIENEKRLDISIVPKEFREKVNSIFYTKNLVLENAAELIAQKDLAKQLCQAFLKEAMQGKLTKQNTKEGNATDLLKEINAEKEKLIAEKKLKKQTAYPQIKEAEIPFSIPKNWAWCRLGMIGICQTGTTPSTTVKEYFGKDIPFIKPADITLKGLITDNEGLSFLGLKEGVLIPNNSLMMVCIGGSIGKSYYTDFNVSCNQQINTIDRKSVV